MCSKYHKNIDTWQRKRRKHLVLNISSHNDLQRILLFELWQRKKRFVKIDIVLNMFEVNEIFETKTVPVKLFRITIYSNDKLPNVLRPFLGIKSVKQTYGSFTPIKIDTFTDNQTYLNHCFVQWKLLQNKYKYKKKLYENCSVGSMWSQHVR